LLAIYRERAGTALAIARAVVFEIELEGVLAGGKLLSRNDTILVLRLIGERIIKFRFAI
jgi:hypothetical protein